MAEKRVGKLNNNGSAIITAMVVGFVVMAFCLTMLMLAYSLFASAVDREVDLPDRELAYSIMNQIDREITSEYNSFSDVLVDDRKHANQLWFYLRNNVGQDSFEAAEEDNKFFEIDGMEKSIYSAEVGMHWLEDEDIKLYVTVELLRDGETIYSVCNEYRLDASIEYFDYDGTLLSGFAGNADTTDFAEKWRWYRNA